MVPRLRVASLVLLVAAAAVACALYVHDSPDGPGIGFDSAHYLSTATNLQHGHGLDVSFTSGFDPLPTSTALAEYGRVPLTHFPPGYPVALVVADALLPGGLFGAARAIGFVAVALTVLCAFVILRAMRAGPVLAALGALLIGLTPALQRLAMWVLSDAIAAALAVCAVAIACLQGRPLPLRWPGALHRASRDAGSLDPWVQRAAGLMAALAVLVRYGGVGGAVGAFVVCVDWHAAWRARVAVALRTMLPSVLVVVTLFVVNAVRGAGEARPVAWHPPGRYDGSLLFATTGMWTIGNHANHTLYAASAVLFVAVAVAALLLWPRRGRAGGAHDPAPAPPAPASLASPARIATALGAFSVTQVLVLLATSSLLDNDVGFDRRLMLPAELAVGIVLVGVLATRRHAVLSAAVIAGLSIARLQVSTGPFPQGTAVPHPPTYDSIFDAVDDYPVDTVLATSVPEVVWGTTGRASIFSPAEVDTLSGRRTRDLDARLREMGRLVGARGGILLLQRVESPRLTRPSDVERVLPCARIVAQNESALLYELAACAG